MIDPSAQVADWVLASRRTVVFTGAGMSTESGIPDFRSPGGLWSRYDPTELTFQRYTEELAKRRSGEIEWDAYSPYELRTVGALVRLGQRDEALTVLDTMLADRRPLAWNQWPEIVWRDQVHRRHAAHLGGIGFRPSRARPVRL